MTTTATETPTIEANVPFHLRGNYAPVPDEIEAFELAVEGALPPELNGFLLRNGPNPKTGSSPHWFFGDGMLHAVELRDGQAKSYRNRWVRTRQYLEDASVIDSESGIIDRTIAAANTHVVPHAGKVFALVESSFPTEVTCELETIGSYDFGGKLTTAMTAHPKVCPKTGELHFFGYSFAEPYLVYHCADARGRLTKSEQITVPGPTMMHDFAITERNVIFMDLPICFDLERAMRGTMPYAWNDAYGARVGIMPRAGADTDVRWFEIEPCYVFHPLNAYDDGTKVVVDVARYDELWRGDPSSFQPAHLHRWTIDTASGDVSEARLDDRAIEFPRGDERRAGIRHRYGYAVWNDRDVSAESNAIVKYDVDRGSSQAHEFGPGRSPGEGVFVAASESAAEDEGWVLTVVYDAATNGSDLVVLDAQNIAAKPVATVRLPRRVPFGFHGSWVPAT